jgi:hypothetical protein
MMADRSGADVYKVVRSNTIWMLSLPFA